jgi:hypothetical protein
VPVATRFAIESVTSVSLPICGKTGLTKPQQAQPFMVNGFLSVMVYGF